MTDTSTAVSEASEPEIQHVVLACDESGAKGYADAADVTSDGIGVFAGIMVPGEKLAEAQPDFDQMAAKFASPDGKLHITDLTAEKQRELREEVYRLVLKHRLPVLYEAIHVAGFNRAHKSVVDGVEAGKKDRRSPIKMSANPPPPPSLHVELFQGLYSRVVEFCMERNKRRLHIEVRTDRVDSPIVTEFEAAAKKLTDTGAVVKTVKGFDPRTKKVVHGTISVGAPGLPPLDVSIEQFELKVRDDTDGLVVAADVLVNSLNHLFKNRSPEEKYRALNVPEAYANHPLKDCLDALYFRDPYNFTDTFYRHPLDPALNEPDEGEGATSVA